MNKKNLSVIAFVIPMLSGCPFPLQPDEFETSCKSRLNTSADKITFSGLEIPFFTEKPLKIGAGTYEPADVSKLTNYIAALDTQRMNICNLRPLIHEMSQPEKNLAIASMVTANNNLTTIASQIKTNTDSTSVVGDAKKLKEEAAATQPATIPPSTSAIDPKFEATLSQILSKLHNIETGMSSETAASISAERALKVYGFASGTTVLSASMQSALKNDLLQLSGQYRNYETAIYDVVGYTDTAGSLQRNIQIGMSRAKAVAEFLKQNNLQTVRTVASGGEISGDNSRRVEILVSGLKKQRI